MPWISYELTKEIQKYLLASEERQAKRLSQKILEETNTETTVSDNFDIVSPLKKILISGLIVGSGLIIFTYLSSYFSYELSLLRNNLEKKLTKIYM